MGINQFCTTIILTMSKSQPKIKAHFFFFSFHTAASKFEIINSWTKSRSVKQFGDRAAPKNKAHYVTKSFPISLDADVST